MNPDRVFYNSEDSRWYKQGDDPWTVRIVAKGDVVRPIPSVEAGTYCAAVLGLFGHLPFIPPVRAEAPRRCSHEGERNRKHPSDRC